VEEWLRTTELTPADFALGWMHSMNPTFLDISLKSSLQKMNLETIDCAILQTPFELRPSQPKHQDKQNYLYALATAFEYYESAV
jgi:hypothetical protein